MKTLEVSMDAEQEQQMVTSLNQIAYSLEFLTRYASVLCFKFGVPEPQPPDARDQHGNPVQRR
jgi:hypothetical protein